MSAHPQQGSGYDGYGHGQAQGGGPNDSYYQENHYDDRYYDERGAHGEQGGQGYYDEA